MIWKTAMCRPYAALLVARPRVRHASHAMRANREARGATTRLSAHNRVGATSRSRPSAAPTVQIAVRDPACQIVNGHRARTAARAHRKANRQPHGLNASRWNGCRATTISTTTSTRRASRIRWSKRSTNGLCKTRAALPEGVAFAAAAAASGLAAAHRWQRRKQAVRVSQTPCKPRSATSAARLFTAKIRAVAVVRVVAVAVAAMAAVMVAVAAAIVAEITVAEGVAAVVVEVDLAAAAMPAVAGGDADRRVGHQ